MLWHHFPQLCSSRDVLIPQAKQFSLLIFFFHLKAIFAFDEIAHAVLLSLHLTAFVVLLIWRPYLLQLRSGSHTSGVIYFRRCNHGTIDVHCALPASGQCIGSGLVPLVLFLVYWVLESGWLGGKSRGSDRVGVGIWCNTTFCCRSMLLNFVAKFGGDRDRGPPEFLRPRPRNLLAAPIQYSPQLRPQPSRYRH